jgi:hypothetical protein
MLKYLCAGLVACALLSAPALAAEHKPAPHGGFPSPFTPFTPPAAPPIAPIPIPITPIGPGDIVGDLIKAKGDILKQLQAADAMDRQIIPGSNPPEMWDPIGHMCIAGIGPEGQPGYVPGLAGWIANLAAPPLPPAAPGSAQGPVIAFTAGRLAVIAALRVTTALQTTGIPIALRQSCGGLLADINNQALTASAQVAAFAKLFAVLIPK